MTLVLAIRRRLDRLMSTAAAAGELPGAARIRRCLALLFSVYAVTLIFSSIARGNVPKGGYVLILMGAGALYANRGGRFVRDWLPVILGLFAYSMAGTYAEKMKFGIHYLPQIDIDKALFGGLPTVWLQHHLYNGTIGPLEVFASFSYLSHFFGPVFLGFYLWWTNRRDAFTTLMFSLLAACVLAETTFVLAPTAPPWMAANRGLIAPVPDLFKQTLLGLNMNKAAAFIGNSHNYNTVAAMPSLHAAFPIIGFLVCVRFGVPRRVRLALVVQWFAILFAIVYLGEHYVSDALVGAIYGLAAFALVARVLGVRRRKAGGKKEAATPEEVPPARPLGMPGLAKPASAFESIEG